MDTVCSPRSQAVPAPRTARLLALSMLARTPEAALGILLILRVRELGGSFALAGLASAAMGIGLAAGGPLLGRIVDRGGQTRVLVATGVVASAALILAAAVPAGTSPTALIPVGLLMGICAPPIAACARALFAGGLQGQSRHGALALDSALQEISFTTGPLVFVAGLGATSPGAGLAAAAVALLAGTLGFAATSESRRAPADPRRRARWGALQAPGVRTLLAVSVGMGAMFGATEVALTSVAEHHGGPTVLGLLVVVWSVPSLLAGLAVARRPEPKDLPRALAALCVVAALLTAGLALMSGLGGIAVLLAMVGAMSAPLFTTTYSLAASAAPAGTLTEAYTWLGSGLFAGVAAGSALGGVLISMSGIETAFLAGGVAVALAAVTAGARAATLAPSPAA